MCIRKEKAFYITHDEPLDLTIARLGITKEKYCERVKNDPFFMLFPHEIQVMTTCTEEEIKMLAEILFKKYSNVHIYKIPKHCIIRKYYRDIIDWLKSMDAEEEIKLRKRGIKLYE